MAKDTPHFFQRLVFYQVYVRSHSPSGDFAGVETDLERIRSMDVDVVYFLPIHPLGEIERKGLKGSPYSISDYRAINPEFGTLEDFRRVVERIHALGMKVMIDVVYNHTAHDSVLVREHPDWFHQDAHGKPVTTVPDWSDVIDLVHPNPALTEYLIETILYWVQQGVDGFRCDVASLVPVDFWKQARAAVAAVKPGIIWLAESVHAGFVISRREKGLFAVSDSELYQAFDILYDYDIWPAWQHAVKGAAPVRFYLDMLRFQDGIYPQNYVKLRCVENHDQPRIMRFAPSREQAMAWIAFSAFNKGPFFIYAGQEAAATHRPSLFEIEEVDWNDYELQPFHTRLAQLKKHPALHGTLVFPVAEPLVQACWYYPGGSLWGIFNTGRVTGHVGVQMPDGDYTDWLSGETIMVKNGEIPVPAFAWVFECLLKDAPRAYHSPLLHDYLE